MKLFTSVLAGLVLLACANKHEPSLVSASTSPATCCDQVDDARSKGTLTLSSTNLKMIACCVSMLHASCVLNYPIGGTGGASSGGAAGSAGTTASAGKPSTPSTTDWSAVCIKAELSKAVNRNMAAQSGMTISAIANSVCSQTSVLNCYSHRICK